MRSMIDFFPETPAGFHLRVENTLMNLEERNMKQKKAYSRRMIALLAAVLVLVFAAAAAAVVQSDVLRTKMNASGGEKAAALVQDVHMADGSDGFSFTVEEVLREGGKMYISYTVSVPDDGKIYLFSPCGIRMNDRQIFPDGALDTEFFATMYALGGAYGTSVTQIMQIDPEETCLNAGQNMLGCQCIFMEAGRPLEKLDAEAFYALLTEPDSSGAEHQLMRNADILYYFDTMPAGDPVPVVYLFHYPEVRRVFDEHAADLLTAADLENAGIASHARTCEVLVPLEGAGAEGPKLNDVLQRVYFMDGYSIVIEELSISRFCASFRAVIRSEDDAFTEWSGEAPFGQYYELCNADGTDFGEIDSCILGADVLVEDGKAVYRIEGSYRGIFPVEDLWEICLVPAVFDDGGIFSHLDMERAIRLTPMNNPQRIGNEAEPETDPAAADDLSA